MEKRAVSSPLLVALLSLSLIFIIVGFGLLVALSHASVVVSMELTHRLPQEVSPGSDISDITLLNSPQDKHFLFSLADSTLRYVSGRDVALPRDEQGIDGYDWASLSHLRDVRRVMVYALWGFSLAVVIVVGLVVALVARQQSRLVAKSSLIAGAAVLAIFAVVVALALVNFEGFFAGFHSVFFAEGTWQFDAQSALIRAFPLRFWELEGLIWAVFSTLGSILCIIAGLKGQKSVA